MRWVPPSWQQIRFCLWFLCCLLLLEWIFNRWQPLVGGLFMHMISATAAASLNLLGVPVRLDTSSIAAGFCIMALDTIAFQIIYECTGIFSFFILVAAIAAYPTSLVQKGWGLLLGAGAFFLYSTLRLIALGVVGHFSPAWIQPFHLYFMVLLNQGFMVFLWLFWIGKVRA